MEIIDTHCHLDNDQFTDDLDLILKDCHKVGVTRIVSPGTCRSDWDKLLTLCSRIKGLYPALGLHPVFISRHEHTDINELEHYINNNKIVAIGEIGLDYFIKELDKDVQLFYFTEQLQLAEKYKLPVILHVRKSHDEVIKRLKNYSIPGGIVHAFSGNREHARHYIDLGFKLGFGGVLTYPKATKIRNLAKELPLDSIVLETDAPDMSGINHKGERNSPAYIIEALSEISDIRNEDMKTIAKTTTSNAKTIFGDMKHVIRNV